MLGRRALLAGVAGAIAAAGSAAAREWRVLPDGCVTADGTWLAYNVFLPPGFDPTGGPYPLLVLLHGAGADQQFWAGKIRLWNAVERGIAEGRVAAPIAVMPGARDTWWVDSPMALAESWVVRDLLADVALKYPVSPGREGRAIAGYSAGGFGALRIALRRPDLFARAALWAPACYADLPPAFSGARRSAAFRGADGAFDEAAWRAVAWPRAFAAYTAQPLRVPFFLATGDADPLGIAQETLRLAEALRRVQPEAVTLRLVDTGHTMRVWEETADEALAFLLPAAARVAARAG